MAKKSTPKKVAAKKIAAVVKKSSPKTLPKAASKKAAIKKPAPKSLPKPAPKAVVSKKAPLKKKLPPVVKIALKPKPTATPAAILKKPIPVAEPAAIPAVLPSPRLAPKTTLATAGSMSLSVQTSQGAAGNGNTHAANILVVITSGGVPIVDLNRDHFTLMEHFEVPGQDSSFSNNITSFRNAGTGAYLLQTKPSSGAPWRSGHHLGQLLVSSDDDRQGQAAIKIIIR